MKMLVMILNKVEVLEPLLEKLSEAGISGATILSSVGMAKTLYNSNDSEESSSSFMNSIRMMLNPERAESKTIISVLKQEQVDVFVKIADQILGGIDKPDAGFIFTVPVDFIKGVEI